MILSTLNANRRLGAWKFETLRFPVAFEDPREARRLVKFAEFCVNCRLAFFTFSGCVSDGVFSEAFCNAPAPLKFMPFVFLMGPVACTSRVTLPLPLIPSAALTPYAL